MTTIVTKNGSGAPTSGDLVQGELAVDLTNKRLYTEDSGGSVIEVGSNPTTLTTGNITATGTVTVPDGSYTIAKTTGLQSALDLKAPLASPTFTGTVTVPDGSYTIAKTTGLQSALDAKAALSGASFTGNITTTGRGVAGTNTASISGSTTLDFSADQNFVLTMTGDVTLANPTTEAVGQTGFITFIQDGTGGRTLSLGSQFKTANGAGITLSSAADAEDIVPYAVTEDGSIFLGAPQLAFS